MNLYLFLNNALPSVRKALCFCVILFTPESFFSPEMDSLRSDRSITEEKVLLNSMLLSYEFVVVFVKIWSRILLQPYSKSVLFIYT